MQDEQVEQTADDQVESGPSAADSEMAARVDQQAAESSGSYAEQAPEVPDDAQAAIARAEEHIAKLNMDKERAAAKRAM
jgi:hypothetical protein